MPIFKYVAKNSQGEVKEGDLEGADKRSIVESLRNEGFFVTTIFERQAKSQKSSKVMSFFSKVSLKDKMMFARHLGVMLGSGLSLPRALKVISNQTKNRKFQAVLGQLENEVKMGTSLGDSLEKAQVFDDLSINMIRVGEVAGNLEEVLKLLADQLEKEHSLISKVRGAMYYPGVIMLVMFVIGIAMMTYVVPSITAIFSDVNTELPFSTKIVIGASNFMKDNQILVFGMIILIAAAIFVFFKTIYGKRATGFLFLKTPVINKITIKVNNARFARIYGSLIKSGVPIAESLRIISETLTNRYYQEAFKKIQEGVQKGKPLYGELSNFPKLFPVLIIQMVEVGEETGKTVDVLLDLAKFYEEEIDQATKNISSIIEPVLMVIIGSAVGFFAVSMIMPMYSVMDQM
ncbi:MAG: type II secretion system F family protein [Parcubacteria group bacterium]|jgi:type IV pilus assembly protein PilC